MWSDCFSASTNARLPWGLYSGPTLHGGRGAGTRAEAVSRASGADPPSLPCPMGSCRYFPDDSAGLFPTSPGLAIPCPSAASPPLFMPTPPGFAPLAQQQLFRSPCRARPSSLPGRLSRALSLGTTPSLTRTGKRHSGVADRASGCRRGAGECRRVVRAPAVETGGTGFKSWHVPSSAFSQGA